MGEGCAARKRRLQKVKEIERRGRRRNVLRIIAQITSSGKSISIRGFRRNEGVSPYLEGRRKGPFRGVAQAINRKSPRA